MYPGNDRKSESLHDIREYSWYSRVSLTILMTNINDAFLGWLSISCSLFSSFRWKMIPQYSHLITVSGCLILTTVNWLWFGCKCSFNDCWKVWHTRSAYIYSQNDRFSCESARWSCDICQKMPDFDSCQFILIWIASREDLYPLLMAYMAEGVV